MKKSYQTVKTRSRRVRVTLTLERRYVRFLLAEQEHCKGRRLPLCGARGAVASFVRGIVDDLAEDTEFMPELVPFGVDLADWEDRLNIGSEQYQAFCRRMEEEGGK